VVDNSGNVGIGTTTPTHKLSIDGGLMYIGGIGTSTIEDNLHVKGNMKVGDNSLFLTENSISASTGLTINPNSTFNIVSSGKSMFYIDESGNIGIGTTSPLAKLDIAGDLSFRQAGVNWVAKSSWDPPGSGYGFMSLVDIDNDGDYDLFIGDNSTDNGGDAYENTGTASSPTWTNKDAWDLPYTGASPNPFQDATFADLDNDGDHDVLIGGGSGICHAYENTGSTSSPTWTNKDAWDVPDITSANMTSPSLVDIDNDGDYDVIVGHSRVDNRGVTVFENTGSSSSPTWTINSNWVGNIKEGRIETADLDNDGDYDLISGYRGYENVGSISSPVWRYNPLWEVADSNLPTSVSVAIADLDNDGDVDMLAGYDAYENSPSLERSLFASNDGLVGIKNTDPIKELDIIGDALISGNIHASTAKFNGLYSSQLGTSTLAHFKNNFSQGGGLIFDSSINKSSLNLRPIGSFEIKQKTDVNWTETATSEWNLPNLGAYNYFGFADLDNDGDLDLVNGYQAYENTGTVSNPIWTSNPRWNTAETTYGYSRPVFADLDNDGDYDNFVLNLAYENTGTASNPTWTNKDTWDIPFADQVAFADLDNDGDYDVLAGNDAYENTGSASNPVWTDKNDWNLPISGTSPVFADLDNDGDYDVILDTNAYENTGSASNPVWTDKNDWDPPVSAGNAPTLADLDNDGDYDLITSPTWEVVAFKNTGNQGTSFFVGNFGNVGIGTSTPTSKLHVAGDLNVTGTTTFGGVSYTWPTTAGAVNYVLSTDGAGGLSWSEVDGVGGGVTGSAQADQLAYWNATSSLTGSSNLTYDGTDFALLGGNMGIGTTSPGEKLEIYGTNEALKFNDGSYSHIIQNSNAEGLSGTDLRIGLDTNNLALVITGNDKMDHDIGLSDYSVPTLVMHYRSGDNHSKLTWQGLHTAYGGLIGTDVSGRHVFDNNYGVTFRMLNSNSYADGEALANAIRVKHDTGRALNDTDGEQSFVLFEPIIDQSGTAAYNALKINVTETSLGDGSTGDGNNLLNLAVGGTSTFRVNNSGNVIVGNYSQSNTLRITDDGVGGDGEDDILFAPDDLTLDTYNVGLKIGTGATGQSIFSSYKDMKFHSTDQNFIFQTGSGEEKVRITNSGNIGIGTTTPTSKLHVLGDLTVTGTTTFGGVTYTWPSTAGTNNYVLSTDGSGGLSWAEGGGSTGGISGSGTADQLTIWSGSDSITGTSSLTYDGVDLTIGGSLSLSPGSITDTGGSITFGTSTATSSNGKLTAGVLIVNNSLGIGTTSPAYPVAHSSGAHLTTGGAWTDASSESLKTDFEVLDKTQILSGIVGMDIQEWRYKNEGSTGVRHIGPTAEVFHGTFGLNPSADSIAPLDTAGVALVGIQALSDPYIFMEKVFNIKIEIGDISEEPLTNDGVFVEAIRIALNRLGVAISDGIVSITETLTARRVQTEELCVDDVCLTADDLRHLLNGSESSSGGSSSEGTSSSGGTNPSNPVTDTTEDETATGTDPVTDTTDSDTATGTDPVTDTTDSDTATGTDPVTDTTDDTTTDESNTVVSEPSEDETGSSNTSDSSINDDSTVLTPEETTEGEVLSDNE
jgi:uncharacterized protein YuzB (UPF0349 family)